MITNPTQTPSASSSSSSVFLSPLSERDWSLLMTGADRLHVKPGQVIIEQDHIDVYIYRLEQGVLNIVKDSLVSPSSGVGTPRRMTPPSLVSPEMSGSGGNVPVAPPMPVYSSVVISSINRPGTIFGEISALGDRRASANVVAATPAIISCIKVWKKYPYMIPLSFFPPSFPPLFISFHFFSQSFL